MFQGTGRRRSAKRLCSQCRHRWCPEMRAPSPLPAHAALLQQACRNRSCAPLLPQPLCLSGKACGAAEGRVACACAAAGLRHDARLCRNGAPHRRQDGARSSPSETVTVDCLTRSRLRLEDQKQEAGSRGAVRSENTELNTAVEVFNSVASFVVRTRISFEIGCRSVASGRTPFRKGYVPPPSVTRSGTAPF